LVNLLVVVIAILILLYFPVASLQLILMLRNILVHDRAEMSVLVPGRRVIVEICTNGQNPSVVEHIIDVIKGYGLNLEIYVVKEDYDLFHYSANEIVVPKLYTTKNGSRKKMRGLHYGIEYLHAQGYGSETYICHLDDDSLVERDYLQYIYGMSETAGQGTIKLREYGHHLLSTLADIGRVYTCDVLCRHFNTAGKPMEVHGEGLTIRADAEYDVGWDFGTYGAEDLMMGQSLVKKGYTFGFIPYDIYIAPPVSMKDFYKQRRRWAFSLLWSVREIRAIRPVVLYWLMYRYVTTWTGFTGLIILPYTLLLGPPVPFWIVGISIFNTVSYWSSYQYGASKLNRRYMPTMLLLQIVVALYEGATIVYGAVFPPDRNSFDVIKKV